MILPRQFRCALSPRAREYYKGLEEKRGNVRHHAQVISQRYERGSIVLTTNQPYKHWPKNFNNDSTLTSAVLDRLLLHAESIIIDGKSYRMKDQIEAP